MSVSSVPDPNPRHRRCVAALQPRATAAAGPGTPICQALTGVGSFLLIVRGAKFKNLSQAVSPVQNNLLSFASITLLPPPQLGYVTTAKME